MIIKLRHTLVIRWPHQEKKTAGRVLIKSTRVWNFGWRNHWLSIASK